MRLANQALVLALSRFTNVGLLLFSPIVLVRLLSVEEFGAYREFLVYAAIMETAAAFQIDDSLLYFVPRYPQSPWRVVRQSVLLLALTSSLVIGLVTAADVISGGRLVGEHLLPLVLYTGCLVNMNFWPGYFLASGRPKALFVYSTTRLSVRLATAIAAAALTHDARAIIWSLIAFEAARLVGSFVIWRVRDASRGEPPVPGLWREQLRFCIPTGFASLLQTITSSLARIVLVKAMGQAALAKFTAGGYLQSIVFVVRNSVSSVVLPEMVRRQASADQAGRAQLELWRRATLVLVLLLLPLALYLARFAELVVVTLFGRAYAEGAIVLQILMVVVVRECFDFAPPLRSVNRTVPILTANALALLTCGVALVLLMPQRGLAGAAIGLALAKVVEAIYLGAQVMRLRGLKLRELIDWATLAKITLAALVAVGVIADPFWTERFGSPGALLAGAAFAATYLLLLAVLKVPELAIVSSAARQLGRAMGAPFSR